MIEVILSLTNGFEFEYRECNCVMCYVIELYLPCGSSRIMISLGVLWIKDVFNVCTGPQYLTREKKEKKKAYFLSGIKDLE